MKRMTVHTEFEPIFNEAFIFELRVGPQNMSSQSGSHEDCQRRISSQVRVDRPNVKSRLLCGPELCEVGP